MHPFSPERNWQEGPPPKVSINGKIGKKNEDISLPNPQEAKMSPEEITTQLNFETGQTLQQTREEIQRFQEKENSKPDAKILQFPKKETPPVDKEAIKQSFRSLMKLGPSISFVVNQGIEALSRLGVVTSIEQSVLLQQKLENLLRSQGITAETLRLAKGNEQQAEDMSQTLLSCIEHLENEDFGNDTQQTATA